MSRIRELLKGLHKPAASLGFSNAASAAPKRRMLLAVRIDRVLQDEDIDRILGLSDIAITVAGAGDRSRIEKSAAERRPPVPTGCWIDSGVAISGEADGPDCDFYACALDGPLSVLADKDKGKLMRIDSGIEPSRLRAIAELGIDAVVADSQSLDMRSVSSVAECRRMHSVSGRPVVLHVHGAIEPSAIAIFWRAGVDALLTDSSVGVQVIETIRIAMDAAPYESRVAPHDSEVVIGAHIGALGLADAHENEEEGGEEQDDDDDD